MKTSALDAQKCSFYSQQQHRRPSLFIPLAQRCLLAPGDGCGNNAYWVKTNLYTNLRSENFQQFLLFDHHAPLQETLGEVHTPGTCMTTDRLAPISHSGTVIGRRATRSFSYWLALSDSSWCLRYSRSRAPHRRHSASVFVLSWVLD